MTKQCFLAHFVCWEKGVEPMSIICADPLLHTITVTPYEREVAGTRFCDGILIATNTLFEEVKSRIIIELKAKSLFSLSELAFHLSHSTLWADYCQPPICRLYAILPSQQAKDIALQEILLL